MHVQLTQTKRRDSSMEEVVPELNLKISIEELGRKVFLSIEVGEGMVIQRKGTHPSGCYTQFHHECRKWKVLEPQMSCRET